MDWADAIERNREHLLGIVTRMFVLAGIRTGVTVGMLPHGLRLRILALLRPAEFAARRLIAMAACKLVTVAMRPASPLPGSEGRRAASNARQSPAGAGTADRGELPPPTRSADPSAARTVCFSSLPARGKPAPLRNTSRPTAKTAQGGSLPAFPLFDPFKPFGNPWLEDGEDTAEHAWQPQGYVPPNQPVDAAALCRRIVALERALQDLEKQAARLARWRARRRAEIASQAQPGAGPAAARVRPCRWSPMRPGYPPGWRRRPKSRIEEVLWECNFLAHDAWDTS